MPVESQLTLYVFREWVSLYTTDAVERENDSLYYKLFYGAYKCLFIIALIIFYLAYKSLV